MDHLILLFLFVLIKKAYYRINNACGEIIRVDIVCGEIIRVDIVCVPNRGTKQTNILIGPNKVHTEVVDRL